MALLQFLLLAIFLDTISSDIMFQFGYKPEVDDFPVCYERDSMEGSTEEILTASFKCEVNSLKFISGVDVRLTGSSSMIGGASLEKKLGKQDVTVKLWSKRSSSLVYEIFVFADFINKARSGNSVKKFY